MFIDSKLRVSALLCCTVFSFFNLSLATDQFPPFAGNGFSASDICSATQYPSFCRTALLPFGNIRSNVNDFGRISLGQAIPVARSFLQLVRTSRQMAQVLFPSLLGPLNDCELLAQDNIDFLLFSSKSINSTNVLQDFLAGDVQAVLSATLTNLDTCFDGLKASVSSSRVFSTLEVPIAEFVKLCSLSLNLFKRGWLYHPKQGARKLEERNHIFSSLENGVVDGLPLRMLEWDRQRFELLTNRRVLQASPVNGVNVSSMVVVDMMGRGNFTTINDAVAFAPNKTDMASGFFLIYVMKGTYMEYVNIPRNKQYIMMIGEGIGKTIITGNRSYIGGSSTFDSSTFAVLGQGFVGINMTIRNTAGAINHQAVALRNSADMSTFYSCSFEGYQDTLYTHSLRQFYRNCNISGTVDFIFGNAAVVFQNCNIIVRLPMSNQFNAITAQGKTDPNQNTGIVIQNCTVTAARELIVSNYTVKSYLGRPWKNYSTTVIMQSSIDGFINPEGWTPWNGDDGITTLYYAEYNNTGPGSITTGRVRWPGLHFINATDAYRFTVTNFTAGNFWLPITGISFKPGL